MKDMNATIRKVNDQIEETISKAETFENEVMDIVTSVDLSVSEEEKLKKLGEVSGVEIDNVPEEKILEEIIGKFNVREYAKPLENLSKSLEEEVMARLAFTFPAAEKFDQKELRESIRETWIDLKDTYNIRDGGFAERHMKRLHTDPRGHLMLYGAFKKVILSERKESEMFSKQFRAKELEMVIACMSMCSMIEDSEKFIEKEARAIELFAQKSSKLDELKNKINKDLLRSEIKNYLIDILNDGEYDNLDQEDSIYNNYAIKSKSLETLGAICREYEDPENKDLEIVMREQGDYYIQLSQVFDYVLRMEYVEPLKTYFESLKNRGQKATGSLKEEYTRYIHTLAKRKMKIPFPGLKETDRTEREVVQSMTEYFEETFKKFNAVWPGDMQEFSITIMIMLARVDKKLFKHVDLQEDKIEAFRFFLIYDTLCRLHVDKQYFTDLLNKIMNIVGEEE